MISEWINIVFLCIIAFFCALLCFVLREFWVPDFHWHNSMEISFLGCMHCCCFCLCPRCSWLYKLNRKCFIHQFPVFHSRVSICARNLPVLPQPGEHMWWITWAIKWRHLCEQCTWTILWRSSVIKAEKGNKNEYVCWILNKLNRRVLQGKGKTSVCGKRQYPLPIRDKIFSVVLIAFLPVVPGRGTRG